jgi:hypothetical protein
MSVIARTIRTDSVDRRGAVLPTGSKSRSWYGSPRGDVVFDAGLADRLRTLRDRRNRGLLKGEFLQPAADVAGAIVKRTMTAQEVGRARTAPRMTAPVPNAHAEAQSRPLRCLRLTPEAADARRDEAGSPLPGRSFSIEKPLSTGVAQRCSGSCADARSLVDSGVSSGGESPIHGPRGGSTST